MSESALETGIEWNYRTVSSAEGNAFAEVTRAFESPFAHPATKELTPTGSSATGPAAHPLRSSDPARKNP